MEILLAFFYIALLVAIIFFGVLQEYVYKKKSEWDLKKRSRERKADEPPIPDDAEIKGLMLSIVLTILAIVFFIWKILSNTFTYL
jgi:hypothetical protein